MTFKITGETIYLRKTQESDIDIMAQAVDFLRGYSGPSENSKKYFWYRENKANNLAVTSPLENDSHGSFLLTICKISDDSVIGYHYLDYFPEKRVESRFSAIIPSARNGSFYKEAGILRHKFYFEGLQARTAHMKLPLDRAHYLDTLYTSTEREEEITDHGNWRWSTISSSDWSTWIDGQDIYRNQSYTLNWS